MAADSARGELLPSQLTPGVAAALLSGVALFFLSLVLQGSFEPPGTPSHPAVTRASGVVRLAGQPIPGGFLQLHPRGGSVGEHAITPIAADGSFSCDRAPVGPVDLRIRIIGDIRGTLERLAPGQRAALMNLAAVGSPLIWRTTAEGPNRLEVELLEAILQPDLSLPAGAVR